MQIVQHVKYLLLLLISTIVGYFQLAIFLFPTKWDNLSAFFAYKYTAGWWWINGNIPFWDPYQNFGYPMHANPQGYVWYPITWLFNLPYGYSLYSLNIELVLHLFLGAVGVYYLSQQFKVDKKWSYTSGVAYCFSGFALGTSHMIGFTIAYCWLPWVLLFTWLWLKEQSIRNTLLLAVAIYFHITGAYIAFSRILAYILIIAIVIKLLKSKLKYQKIKIVKSSLLLAICILVLSSPFLYSIYDSLGYISRFNALEYTPSSYKGNFSWQCFQTLLFPYINSSVSGFQNVDVSLSNIYIGAITLIGSILGFRELKSSLRWKLGGVIILAFLLALGVYTPIHKLAVSSLPGFNFFRHPYLFTLYPTLILVIISGIGFSNLSWSAPVFKKLLIAFVTLLVGIVIYSLNKTNFSEWTNYLLQVSKLAERSSLNNEAHAVIQGLFILLVLLTCVLLTTKLLKYKSILPYLIVAEMFISVQLNGPLNMYYNEPFKRVQKEMKKFPKTLTNQQASTPIISFNNDSLRASVGLWHNLNSFERLMGADGYNPFIFKSLETLKDSEEFSETTTKGVAYLKNETGRINNFVIGYNTFKIETLNSQQGKLILHQNYHHNWKATVNGVPVTISKFKNTFMSVNTGEGSNKILLHYENGLIRFMHYISVISLFLIFSFLLKTYIEP